MMVMQGELPAGDVTVMYVGNLEPYQGVDLLLDSFALVLNATTRAHLIVIGGHSSDIERYRGIARNQGMESHVRFLGPKPIDCLGTYLAQADILVSPRIAGNNTPLKIYSYLHSGKPLIATDLPTHTQVLDQRVALLCAPTPREFSRALLRLIEDRNLRTQLGAAGKKLIEENFTYGSFREKLNGLLDWLKLEIEKPENGRSNAGHPPDERVGYAPRAAAFGWKTLFSEKRSKKID